MSNVSNVHSVVPFVAGESKPNSGQRLIKIRFNDTAKKKAEYAPVCVSVPFISADMIKDNRLAVYFEACLEDLQDKVAKSLYVSRKGNMEYLSDSDIGVESMLAYLAAESAGSRISAESIGKWFTDYVQDRLIVLLAEKLGYNGESLTDEQMDTILRQAGMVKSIVSLIASKGDIAYNDKQKNAINRCFELASLGNGMDGFGEKLQEKFNAQCGKITEGLLDF
jgi:hypothetical protein